MRIMEIIRDAEGGMKEHYMTLVKGLACQGTEVIALCNLPDNSRRELQAIGIQVISFSFPGTMKPLQDIEKLIRLIRYIRNTKPDLIHCHGFKAGFLGRTAGWMTGVPFVYTVHNFVIHGRGKIECRLIQYFERWMGHKARGIICVSQALKQFMMNEIGVAENKLHVIYNAIPSLPIGDRESVRKKYGICNKELVIGTVARLIPSKGIDTLLKAMAGILLLYPHVRLLIAGSGPEEDFLLKLTDSLSITRQTIFAGRVSNIQDYYSAFDLFVLPTLSEGLGITVLEAMYFGLPIIATAVGGIPEWLTHERNGILIQPNNAFALRTALQTLLEHPEIAAKYGMQAKEDIQKGLSREKMVDKTWDVLKEHSIH